MIRRMKTAHDMGLRLSLYTPEITNDDDDAGVRGFTVVPARRKEITPEMLIIAPANAKATAMGARTGIIKLNRCTEELSHISNATITPTPGPPAGANGLTEPYQVDWQRCTESLPWISKTSPRPKTLYIRYVLRSC